MFQQFQCPYEPLQWAWENKSEEKGDSNKLSNSVTEYFSHKLPIEYRRQIMQILSFPEIPLLRYFLKMVKEISLF